MIWTIKVVFGLLLTSLTGSIYKGDLFLHTQVIMTGCKILLVIWAVGACYILCRQLLMLYRARRMFRASFSCERDVERQFCEVKHRMGIGKNAVGLARCYQTPVAILWGIRKPTVILPVETYTQEELEVIFIHELMHYKHKDILWRRIATALTAVYFFNPFVWKMHKYLRKWSEHACDFEANEIAGGMKHYFNPKEGLIPRSLLRNKLMTNEVSLGLIPRSLLRGVSLRL